MALHVKAMTTPCGFCASGNHEKCPIGVVMRRHTKYPEGIVWVCACQAGECAKKRRRCTECNNTREDEVEESTWLCKDAAACRAVATTRRDSDPQLARIREAREMAQVTETAKKSVAKKAAAPKEGKCVCGCKGKTKGGLFLPGHDARFVSTLVGKAEEAGFSKSAVADGTKTLKDAGASETLQAKYAKSVGLAKDRADKKADAAKEKAATKKAAASAS